MNSTLAREVSMCTVQVLWLAIRAALPILRWHFFRTLGFLSLFTNLLDLRQPLPNVARRGDIQMCTHDCVSPTKDWLATALGGIRWRFWGGFLLFFVLLTISLPKFLQEKSDSNPCTNIRMKNPPTKVCTIESTWRRDAQWCSSQPLPNRDLVMILGKDLRRAQQQIHAFDLYLCTIPRSQEESTQNETRPFFQGFGGNSSRAETGLPTFPPSLNKGSFMLH